ncbi:TagK domain-containing protein [Trinickia fusca]|uniref:TagK domain-containing protein n=1 Tax=Trinickia fusca TaxID=2419777 RepID=A0A494XW48_9BURK|nr:TagK domain-containing protein [Trinickia fusca]RKP52324.1 TagK domain-containing protein [Trinickia fusca]
MRAFKLFRRNEPGAKYAAALPRADALPPAARDERAPRLEWLPTRSPEAGLHDGTRDDNAVFGLIGTAIAAQAFAPGGEGPTDEGVATVDGSVPARSLMQALYEQYCRALEDPQASLQSDGAAYAAMSYRPLPDQRDERHKDAESTDSINGLLSDARVFGDVFDLLGPDDMPDPAAADPIPEVLRLFAPTEYFATTTRRPSNLPPELARREHLALAIDSPAPALGSTLATVDAIGTVTHEPMHEEDADGQA